MVETPLRVPSNCLLGIVSVMILAISLLTPGTVLAAARTLPVIQSGFWHGRPVTYEIVNGKAIYQGDIILGSVDAAPAGSTSTGSAGVAYSSYLWPQVNGVATVYYAIDPQSQNVSNIRAAIAQFNSDFTGLIQWVPHTTQATWVDINLSNGSNGMCEAEEGYQPNSPQPQPMGGASNCTLGTILHEMGHVIGLWHEQSRPDRDLYVTVNYQNIVKSSRSNFDVVLDNIQDYTLYDYASLMQYPAFTLSRNGGPALETIPPGIPLNGSEGVAVIATDYSAGDKEGIMRLYGTVPASITITTNPPNLQVIVDGSNCTAPCLENWALNSQHTLDVPVNAQTVSGNIEFSSPPVATTYYYTFANWNDLGAQSHAITLKPGNGEPGFPVTAPAVSTYTANFVQLVPYNAVTFPSNPVPGTISITPPPQTYAGISGNFLIARQEATLTAAANSGWNFYEFNSVSPYLWLDGGISANPKTFYVPDTGNPVDLNVEFTQSPVYRVDVEPNPTNANAFSERLYAYVDNNLWRMPKSFSPDTALDGAAWNPGTSHTVSVDQYESQWSVNSEYVFSQWNQGSTPTAQSNTIILPASSTNYVATMTPAFAPSNNWQFTLPCGAAAAPILTASQAPEANGNYYPAGTNLTFDSQTPVSGWILAGWTYDLTGNTNPSTLSDIVDESLVYANYNISGTNAPLTLTSMNPSTAVSGGAGFRLTLTGTGFSPNSLVSVNGIYRSVTFVSDTQLTVPVTASDIAGPAAFQVFVENFPPGSNGCAVFAALPFFVSQGATMVSMVAPTPASLKFAPQAVGTTSASATMILKNTGSGSTSLTIAISGDFGETDNCAGNLGAKKNCTVHVMFSPTSAGKISGAVTISDNSSTSPQVVGLSGTGVVPLVFSPTSLTFGNTAVGSTSNPQTVTITNKAASSVSLALSATADFAISTTTCGSTLASAGSCSVSITFTPVANGKSSGALIATDNSATSPQELGLSGTGSGAGASPLLFSPATLTFSNQANGTTSSAKTVTVKNNGKVSLTLGSSFPISANFSINANSCSGVKLSPAATCSIGVTFAPTLVGSAKGALVVNDNGGVDQQIVGLFGTAIVPITFSPASLTFATQAVGTTSGSQTITVTNNESGPVSVSSIVASGDYAVTNNCGGSIAGSKGTCTLQVTFTPSNTGTIPGALTVNSGADGSPVTIGLSGSGQ
ncbi:MAG: choice-of-anchor D domain-containing protein [Acidobacteria bacterium]|nr:choice-of-anchor D domain-containing protein [Acidobacteriota bacterium]